MSLPSLLIAHIARVSLYCMALLRGLFWFALFIVLAFCFVVLFEYGPHNFVTGFHKEVAHVKSFVVKHVERPQKREKER